MACHYYYYHYYSPWIIGCCNGAAIPYYCYCYCYCNCYFHRSNELPLHSSPPPPPPPPLPHSILGAKAALIIWHFQGHCSCLPQPKAHRRPLIFSPPLASLPHLPPPSSSLLPPPSSILPPPLLPSSPLPPSPSLTPPLPPPSSLPLLLLPLLGPPWPGAYHSIIHPLRSPLLLLRSPPP